LYYYKRFSFHLTHCCAWAVSPLRALVDVIFYLYFTPFRVSSLSSRADSCVSGLVTWRVS